MKHPSYVTGKTLWLLLVVTLILSGNYYAQGSAAKPALKNDLLEKGVFIQITIQRDPTRV